jgi:adenylate kinase
VYVILLGAPGAGKGTQAVMMAGELGLAQVASGDLFRKALAGQTELGKKARVYMDKGQLVPDEITIQMVLERLAEPDVRNGAILDGFPRNLGQARALDRALDGKRRAIDKVVYIKVSEGELLKRLGGRRVCRQCQAPYHEVDSPPKVKGKCDRCGGELYQRDDDKPGTFKKRLEVYFAETSPLIDHYRQAGKLLEIDGEGSVAAVNRRVLAALRPEGR